MEEVEEEATNGFNDWERLPLPSHHFQPSSSSSSSSSSHHHHHYDLSIFPPVNHEGLPVPPPPPPPPAPLSVYNSDADSHPSSPSHHSHFTKWFDFALHLWNSKFFSFLAFLRSPGFLSSFRPVATTASFLVIFWLWVHWLRRRRGGSGGGGKENVEGLKRLIKEKDEKIIQLLEQIAQLNKLLLSRYRIPVVRAS